MRGTTATALLLAACAGPTQQTDWESPAPPPTPEPEAPVWGASDPTVCVDKVPPEDAPSEPVVSDAMLAGLGACTKKLTKPEEVGISLLVAPDGAIERVHVERSTLGDCELVACLSQKLSKLRLPASKTAKEDVHFVMLELAPRNPPRRLTQFAQPLGPPFTSCGEATALRLAPEVIQRTVRANYPAFRPCYEAALAANPHIKGQTHTRFTIERDGRVSAAYITHNDLPDCHVARCLRDAMAKIVFPAPAHGTVTVVYPILLAPAEPER